MCVGLHRSPCRGALSTHPGSLAGHCTHTQQSSRLPGCWGGQAAAHAWSQPHAALALTPSARSLPGAIAPELPPQRHPPTPAGCIRGVRRTPGRGWAPLIALPACAGTCRAAPRTHAAAHAGAPAGRDHRCRSARVTLEVGVAVGTRTTCALARSFLSQQLASVWSAARAARPARARGVQRRAGPRSVVRTHCNAQRCTGALHNAARPCSRQAHMASPLPWRAPWRPAAAGRRPGSAAVARGRDPGRPAAVWEALAVAQGGGRPSARSTHKHQQLWWRCAASSSLALHTDTRCQERRGGWWEKQCPAW